MKKKTLCLGTALWGWTGTSIDSHSLLDRFYESGYRYIDSASIYPINKIATDKGKGLEQISTWASVNGVTDLKVTVKIGGISNMGSSENNLSENFLSTQRDHCHQLLGSNLDCLMVHWDNTSEINQIEVNARIINNVFKDYRIGFSGLKHWKEYIDFTDRNEILVQVKNNLLYDGSSIFTDLKKNKKVNIFAYGTSVSGLKLNQSQYTENSYVSLAREKGFHQKQIEQINVATVKEYLSQSKVAYNFYHLGLILNLIHQETDAIIVAPKNINQLVDIFDFTERFYQSSDLEQKLYETYCSEFIKK